MAPVLLAARALSFSSSAQTLSSSLSRRFKTSKPTLLARSVNAADALMSSTALLTRSLKRIVKRQIVAIPTTYQDRDGQLAPGTVAGIVLGSVAGVVLILYLIYTAFTLSGGRRTAVIDEEIIRRHSVSRSPPRRRRRRSRTEEVVEVRERPRTRERIVVEERRTSVAPAAAEEDFVEVIEEHSPPRRHRSKRESGYRTVDPAEFGGGTRPIRKVRR